MGIQRLKAALHDLDILLEQRSMEPDASRRDWKTHSETLDRLSSVIDEVIAAYEVCAREQEEAGVEAIADVISDRALDVAAVLHLVGDSKAEALRAWALRINDSGFTRAADAHPSDHARLVHAWWLLKLDEPRRAEALARDLSKRAPEALAESARALLSRPKPISSAPGLGTVNGIGLTLYGRRDPWPDGTFIATRFFSAIFVPLIPIDAYRVAEAGPSTYQFFGKVPISGVARWWRRLFFAALASILVVSIYNSPSARFERAVEAVAAEEAGRSAEENVAAYEALVREAPEGARVKPAVEAMVRHLLTTLPEVPSAEGLIELRALIKRCRSLRRFGAGESGRMLAARVLAWAEVIAESDHAEAIQLGLEAERLANGGMRARATTFTRAQRRHLADALAEAAPLDALRAYAEIASDPQAFAAAEGLLASIGDAPSVWLELEPTLVLLRRADGASEALKAAEARLIEAKRYAADPARRALLEQGDVAALRARLAAHPGDHELASALVDRLLAAHELRAAEQVLEGLGPEGRLARPARLALARLHARAGRLPQAEAILEHILTTQLPLFEEARRRFEETINAEQSRLIAQLRSGRMPRALEAKLRGKPEAEQGRIVDAWLKERLDRSAAIKAAQARYEGLASVVPTALELGMVLLERAGGMRGAEREETLAKAERAFLAIQAEAQGSVEYHLGLGQVYHRLGKPEAGDKELQIVLAREAPTLTLAVASVYRELGLEPRAREIAEGLYARAAGKERFAAAALMFHLVQSREERREWLEKSDPEDLGVRLNLMELEAGELVEAGKLDAAAAKLLKVAEGWAGESRQSSAAANNAGNAYLQRFGLTSDPRDLKSAVTLMEEARRLSPENSLIVGNLINIRETQLVLSSLAALAPLEELKLTSEERERVLGALLDGPQRAAAQAAVRKQATLQQLYALTRQHRILAPNRPFNYQVESAWAMWLEDARGLEALAEAAEAAGARLERADQRAQFEAWRAGAMDAEVIAAQRRAIARVRASKGASPRARAVDLALRSQAQRRLALLTLKLADAQAARSSAEEAHGLWSAVGVAPLVKAEALVMLLEVGASTPKLMEIVEQEMREGLTFTLDRALVEPEVAAALKGHPSCARLNQLLAHQPPDLLGALIANLMAEPARLEAARATYERPALRAYTRLSHTLSPYLKGPERARALLRAGPG